MSPPPCRLAGTVPRPAARPVSRSAELTGWEPHSVRGTINGALRKRLNLNVTCVAHVYRIVEAHARSIWPLPWRSWRCSTALPWHVQMQALPKGRKDGARQSRSAMQALKQASAGSAVLTRANRWFAALRSGESDSILSLAKAHRQAGRDVTRTIYLAFLAPDIVERLAHGEQPIGLGVRRLVAMSPHCTLALNRCSQSWRSSTLHREAAIDRNEPFDVAGRTARKRTFV